MSLEPLSGLRVVDLFAGSGALGIEALSRGAERADFVDARRGESGPQDQPRPLALETRQRVWTLELHGA